MDEEFDEWFRQNANRLKQYAVQCTHDKDDADYVVWDCAIRCRLKFRLVPSENWSAYFKKCIKNASIDHQRKKKLPTIDFPESIVDMNFRDLAEAVANRNELREQLDKCLGKLDWKQRQVFVWVHVDEIPQTEIAKREGVTPVAIHQRLKKAIRSLRECLNAYVTNP